jgi:mono/diheme cytochrome c family protein
MSLARRHAVPLAAGLAAAAAAFAVVAATSDDGGSPGGDGGGRQAPEDSRPTAPAAPASPARTAGLEVFTRMGCGGCHRLAAAGSTGPIGPDLDTRLPGHTRESLTAAILTPPAGTIMPPDFGRRMSDAELGALVDFLLSARAPR